MRDRWAWLLSASSSSRGRLGQGRCEGALDDVDDLGLALGHLERVGEAGLELLAPDLRGAARGLAFGVVERGVQLAAPGRP